MCRVTAAANVVCLRPRPPRDRSREQQARRLETPRATHNKGRATPSTFALFLNPFRRKKHNTSKTKMRVVAAVLLVRWKVVEAGDRGIADNPQQQQQQHPLLLFLIIRHREDGGCHHSVERGGGVCARG